MPCERKHVEAIQAEIRLLYRKLMDDTFVDEDVAGPLVACDAALAACDESPWRSMDVPMLPVDGEVVLLWSPSFCHRPVEAYRSTSGKWWLVNGIEVQFPTHWMPLPAAPEVKL